MAILLRFLQKMSNSFDFHESKVLGFDKLARIVVILHADWNTLCLGEFGSNVDITGTKIKKSCGFVT